MKKNYYGVIHQLHKKIVAEIIALMKLHDVVEVDLLGSNADHAYVTGWPGVSSDTDIQEMEVSRVYLKYGRLMLDVVLDLNSDEQEKTNDIGDSYQCWCANDFTHFKACAGIEMVYESVWQVLVD